MRDLWDLTRVASCLGGVLLGRGDARPNGLSIDTRTLQPGDCFVALRAGRDGHDFAAEAVKKGAVALVVDHALDLPVGQVVVPDTLAALQAWGQQRLAAVRPRVVFGVTGSVGKTSTKELLAGATSGWKTPGNRNNTLGLPEALAVLPAGLESAVLEMGMSTPGEIARLVQIAPPDAGIVANVGTAHLENFPEGQVGIARAKGELVAGLAKGAPWTCLAEDPWCQWIANQPFAAHARRVPVGPGALYGWSDVRSLGPWGEGFHLVTPQGGFPLEIRLPGLHQVRNAALAAAIALEMGFSPESIVAGMARVQPEPGRGRLSPLEDGGWLLDESYNASPDSMLACAAALGALEGGPRVAVLGCMRELGTDSQKLHREVGAGLRRLGLDQVLVYGADSASLAEGFGPGATAFPDFQHMLEESEGLSCLGGGMRILVKGSRHYQAEKAVAWILERFERKVASR